MKDPGFVADMRGTMEAFQYTDAERWPAESATIHESNP